MKRGGRCYRAALTLMTTAEMINALLSAETELKQTTVGYVSQGQCKHSWTTPPVGTHWYNAFNYINQVIAELKSIKVYTINIAASGQAIVGQTITFAVSIT